MTTTEIGNRIRQYRVNKGYSQQYMALKLKISQTTYNRIENGTVAKTNPQIYLKIAELIDIDVNKLLFPSDDFLFCNYQQPGSTNLIPDPKVEVTAFLKMITAQLEVLNMQISLLNKYLLDN